MAVVEQPLHRALGLTDDELERIVQTLGREPNRNELAMYGAMWSEHCSYKSSKIHLRSLPTEGSAVLVGPGQDAGAVDVGDGVAVVFKMESHSHPSAIEPYQGAATGVGGIVRDIISMGARPVALLDPLMFGPLTDERNRWLLGGVVAGIGGYGNCIGVPTVGGEIHFAEPHSANPSVNVMCVGIAPADGLMTSASHTAHAGSSLVLFGASTGRDGIGGASVLASATLEDGAEGSRPSVQIGDPFAGKLLIEASLEMIGSGLLEGLQDLGAAGISCAVSESAARAHMGADLDLDAVPLRERGLEAFEILTSESQERMLAVVAPERLAAVRAVCEKWGLASAVIATLVPGDTLTIRHDGEIVAQLPASSLADDGPEYDRPLAPDDVAETVDDPAFIPFEGDLREALVGVLSSPNVASKRWIFEQYDSFVQGQTVASAGLRRRRDPGSRHVERARAVERRQGPVRPSGSVPGGRARRRGGRAERRGHRRQAARDHELHELRQPGAAGRDVAVRRGDPRDARRVPGVRHPGHGRERQLLQRVGRLGDLADAGDRHARPVAGLPAARPDGVLARRLSICVLGETFAELGGSEFADVVLGVISGRPPALDLERERALLDLLHEAASGDLLASAHDCSDGGLAVTLAEQAILSGHGFVVTVPGDLPPHVALFSESASRAIVAVAPERVEQLADLAAARGVPFATLGETGGPRVVFDGLFETTVHELRDVYEGAIPRLLGEDV